VAFLKGAPARARVRSIGLFYRNDGRSLSADDLKNARRQRLPLASVDPVALAQLEEAVVYEFE
jgi:hypothetical protein